MKKNETFAITALLDALSDTPLHMACLYGRSDVVRLLLEKGADVNAKSMTGWSALDYTLDLPPDEPSREEIMDLFRQYAPEAVMEAYCTQSPQS